MDERAFEYLAKKWVDECGPDAPTQIRKWGRHLAPDDAGLFERIAQRAETLIGGRAGRTIR